MNQPTHFSILSSPKYPKMQAAGNIIASMSILAGLGIMYGGYYVSGNMHDNLGREIEGRPGALLPCLIIGGAILLAGISVLIYRKLLPVDKRKEIIGEIVLATSGIQINMHKPQNQWPWQQIRRLDVYLSYGIKISTNSSLDSLFNGSEALHLRILAPDGFKSFHVLNENDGDGIYGDLYQHLKTLRKQNIDLHRKIQFWNKQRF